MSNASDDLRSFIERVERLDEEKREIAEQIKEVFAEAKSHGFDPKTMKAIIRERRMTPAERAEHVSLMEIYRAALGMLDGTPLGEFARRRMMGEDEEPEQKAAPEPKPDDGQTDIEDAAKGKAAEEPFADPTPAPEPKGPTAEDIATARSAGATAATTGKPIIANPFAHDDLRRAAWDEGYCAAAGTDGMDVPAAWRRKKTDKPSKKAA